MNLVKVFSYSINLINNVKTASKVNKLKKVNKLVKLAEVNKVSKVFFFKKKGKRKKSQ